MSTVATTPLLEVQAPSGVVLANCVVAPTGTPKLPVMGSTIGSGLIVALVLFVAKQFAGLVTFIVIITVPDAPAV